MLDPGKSVGTRGVVSTGIFGSALVELDAAAFIAYLSVDPSVNEWLTVEPDEEWAFRRRVELIAFDASAQSIGI